jgi:hypothetical protein
METVPPATPSYQNRNDHALHSQKRSAFDGTFRKCQSPVRKLLRATLIVKRETSIAGELWAAFTAAAAVSTLAEIANFSRAQPQATSRRRVRTCGIECLFMAPLRHANRFRNCPLVGVDRKWRVCRQNDANDPTETLGSSSYSIAKPVSASIKLPVEPLQRSLMSGDLNGTNLDALEL